MHLILKFGLIAVLVEVLQDCVVLAKKLLERLFLLERLELCLKFPRFNGLFVDLTALPGKFGLVAQDKSEAKRS